MRCTAFLFLLYGCAAVPVTSNGYGVRVNGSLGAIMHEGQREPIVTLGQVLPDPGAYAVGALADLAGEVTIVEGQTYLSYPQGSERTRTESLSYSNAAATLLVSASVPAWQSVVTGEAIAFDRLDDAIARLAAEAGVDTGGRFRSCSRACSRTSSGT